MGGVFLLLSKISFYGTTLILIVLILVLCFKFNKKTEEKITEEVSNEYIASYFDGEYQTKIPGKNDGYVVDKIVCDNGAIATWNNEEWGINIRNATQKVKCSIYFIFKTVYNFDYNGTEQVFTVPKTGTYKIETWGAQGGNVDGNIGLGGFSNGYIFLNQHQILYINIGGKGQDGIFTSNGDETIAGAGGGYNGGGNGGSGYYANGAGGGGASHIATKSGILGTLEKYKDTILIVSGGGGGDSSWGIPGSGGGFKGADTPNTYDGNGNVFPYHALGGGQTGLQPFFGQGENAKDRTLSDAWGSEGKGGGGGGFYGGGTLAKEGERTDCGGAGGSGYIGNSLLSNKAMYCYNCEESSEESTKTISTTCAEETPNENCAKKGNGYARITFIE